MKQVANQVKAQNIQSNADRDPSVTNEFHTNFKSVSLYWEKGEHLIRPLRKDMHHTLPGNARMLYW